MARTVVRDDASGTEDKTFREFVCIVFFFFFVNDTATNEIYPLSLTDALPIYPMGLHPKRPHIHFVPPCPPIVPTRSEDHPSDLPSPLHLLSRLLPHTKNKHSLPHLPPHHPSIPALPPPPSPPPCTSHPSPLLPLLPLPLSSHSPTQRCLSALRT